MPIIDARTVETSVVIYNGETVVLGGMIREMVQEYEDKVPILGDVPLIGRLFKSTGESTEKRNLLIFVSARLVDPAGQPLREKEYQGIPEFGR
jgi:general secretion pathway protein D